jgi:two-component system, NarL family, response regulator DegU
MRAGGSVTTPPPDPLAAGVPAVRVLLVDDHRMLREGLRRSLEAEGVDVVAEGADGEEAVRLAGEHRPAVVLMDVSMPRMDGVEATRQIRQRFPEVRVVMLTMHADDEVIARAIRAGADGYLVKDCSTHEVTDTIRLVAGGETALSPQLARSMLAEMRRLDDDERLSKREEEVLQLIADGCNTAEVAAKLFLSHKTVKNHLASIYQKLDARDRTQAVIRAVRMGIIRLS